MITFLFIRDQPCLISMSLFMLPFSVPPNLSLVSSYLIIVSLVTKWDRIHTVVFLSKGGGALFELDIFEGLNCHFDIAWPADLLMFFDIPIIYCMQFVAVFIVLDSSLSAHGIWCYACKVVVTLKGIFNNTGR